MRILYVRQLTNDGFLPSLASFSQMVFGLKFHLGRNQFPRFHSFSSKFKYESSKVSILHAKWSFVPALRREERVSRKEFDKCSKYKKRSRIQNIVRGWMERHVSTLCSISNTCVRLFLSIWFEKKMLKGCLLLDERNAKGLLSKRMMSIMNCPIGYTNQMQNKFDGIVCRYERSANICSVH